MSGASAVWFRRYISSYPSIELYCTPRMSVHWRIKGAAGMQGSDDPPKRLNPETRHPDTAVSRVQPIELWPLPANRILQSSGVSATFWVLLPNVCYVSRTAKLSEVFVKVKFECARCKSLFVVVFWQCRSVFPAFRIKTVVFSIVAKRLYESLSQSKRSTSTAVRYCRIWLRNCLPANHWKRLLVSLISSSDWCRSMYHWRIDFCLIDIYKHLLTHRLYWFLIYNIVTLIKCLIDGYNCVFDEHITLAKRLTEQLGIRTK